MSLKKASRVKSLSLSDDIPIRSPKPRNTASLSTMPSSASKRVEDIGKMLKYIEENIVGKGVAFLGPFGRRKAVYADYFSCGRSLQFFEEYINKEVLPALGDTTCTSSVTGLQSHLYSKEARQIIATAVNASSDDHIIFCEAKHTIIIERLCHFFCYSPNAHSGPVHIDDVELRRKGPVLFISSSEPAKHIRIWENAGAQIVIISKTREGFLDLVDLENKLSSFSDSKRLLIGLFSGASRSTGIEADCVATTILLHQYGAIGIWDYCLAAPYASIDMNPLLPGSTKDVLFFSTKKFIGGVQGPGVLIIKKSLISSHHSTVFEDSVGVVETIRAGLAMQLKESLGIQNIAARQEKLCKQILSHIRTIPEIILLGPLQTTAKRIPLLSFLVKHPRGSFLHHRFVVAVLNDVFGIQATGTSYIGEILGINKTTSRDYDNFITDTYNNAEFIRPGYTNLLIPYFMSDAEVGFILEALKMVATEAWKLLPQYEYIERTGEWRHHSNSLIKERKWLGSIRYTDGRMLFTDRRISGPGSFPQNYSECLQTARNLFNRARKMAQKSTLPLGLKLVNETAESLRWFMLPGEAHQLLLGHSQNVRTHLPFDPNKTKELSSLFHMFRHNSLSALDVKRFKSRSLPTSPVQIPMRRQQSSPTPPCSPKTTSLTDCASPPIVRFSLGGEVTTMASFNPQRISNLVNSEEAISSRNSTCSDCAEEIQAYVAEYTKSLATEIKSEIREVISKVEDVLEGTDPVDMSSISMLSMANNNNSGDDSRSDSVSATDVAEYLKGLSKEMASEVKSEIREAVNFIPVENINLNRKSSPPDVFVGKACEKERSSKHKHNDGRNENHESSENRDKQICIESIPRPNSTPGWHAPTAASPENSTPNCPYTGAISKLIDASSTASQDSGINLYFGDQEDTRCRTTSENYLERPKRNSERSQSDSSHKKNANHRQYHTNQNSQENTFTSDASCECISKDATCTSTPISGGSTLALKLPTLERHQSVEGPARDLHRWQHLPKDIWKQTAEAIDEFAMIKDGDRILVCLSGSCASLCLLHALRQFSRARGIHIDMAAITVGKCGIDPRALMLYMRDIDIELYIIEQLGASENYRTKICALARRKHYNVLAMGNTLDKIADEFLVSVLTKGRLFTPQAHCINREGDLRVIRPFIFVREKCLENFVRQKNMPARPSTNSSKPLDASNSILKVQEMVNPNVFENIKNALRPLLSFRLETNKSTYEHLKLNLMTRD
ncbi:uncharacterized protein LOC119653267 isoform X2 [Hermetia illucens]|uniref:uncharacterized protein LOC119653267 isoform X2 n=1 Tax=Hermetia illucens TaxID=343691 RepID=UPI0018CC1C69|nr:uncharacterized protein LOC119653267 isoform X2 [Hermetia illucens]